ncbi:hypothetical protein [Roseivirga sp.]|uniref:hypothetical protein n=1 Tax=Roseivirga sp. TaxID=1964215 RepID=UPI003B8AAC70
MFETLDTKQAYVSKWNTFNNDKKLCLKKTQTCLELRSIFQSISHLFKRWEAILKGELRSIGEFYTDIQNSIRQPAYTLVNARLGISNNKFTLHFWVQNITDEAYRLSEIRTIVSDSIM